MNRSSIGLSFCAYQKSGASAGVALPGAVQADIAINRDNVQKFADNTLIFEINDFKSGTLTLKEVAWSDTVYTDITGNTLASEGTAPDVTTYIQDIKSPKAPDVEFGFIADTMSESSGTWSKAYTAVYFPLVRFVASDSSIVTRGDSTAFSDPTLIGTIYANSSEVWREMKTFTTFSAAQSWLATKLSITLS